MRASWADADSAGSEGGESLVAQYEALAQSAADVDPPCEDAKDNSEPDNAVPVRERAVAPAVACNRSSSFRTFASASKSGQWQRLRPQGLQHLLGLERMKSAGSPSQGGQGG